MSTTPNEFKWTSTGLSLMNYNRRRPPKPADFSIRPDGVRRWVFNHYQFKPVVATFIGEDAAKAVAALKVALVTARLTT